jgi:hypothetical protein
MTPERQVATQPAQCAGIGVLEKEEYKEFENSISPDYRLLSGWQASARRTLYDGK